MTALAFDLGDTLVEYEGLPLSWEAHYPDAISNLAQFLNTTVSPEQSEACAAILRTCNTRITPRETEIRFSDILKKISTVIDVPVAIDEVPCATAFFSIFRQRLRAFSDSTPALLKAAQQGHRIGVFTDVPYGMPRELVDEDLRQAGIAHLFPVVVTSIDAGFRKPRPETMRALADRLGCGAGEMTYVGNERKDVEAALGFGCQAVLLDRKMQKPKWGQHRTIHTLLEL